MVSESPLGVGNQFEICSPQSSGFTLEMTCLAAMAELARYAPDIPWTPIADTDISWTVEQIYLPITSYGFVKYIDMAKSTVIR